jgi:CheY-like chemotaxis protein
LLISAARLLGPSLSSAISLAQTAELDAAILDINVGGSVIFPVADILKNRDIPFIFATGYGSMGLPDRFRNSHTLPKPFSYQSLAESLRTVLASRPCHTEAA